MSVYAIIFSEPNKDSLDIIANEWPLYNQTYDNVAFIASDDLSLTTAAIADLVGMNNKKKRKVLS